MVSILKNQFDLISLGILCLLGPLFVFPREKWNWALLVGVAAILLGKWILAREILPRTPIDAAMALLAVWAFLGILATDVLVSGLSKMAGLTFGIVFYYILIDVLSRLVRIKIAIAILISIGLAVAVIGTLSRSDALSIPQIDKNKTVQSVPKAIVKFDRAEKGINPNPLGGTLLLFLPPGIMASVFLLKKKKPMTKWSCNYPVVVGMAIVIGIEVFAIIYSRSTGTLMAFGFILLLMGRKKRFLKAGLGMAALLAFIFVMKSPDLNNNSLIKSTRDSINKSASIRIPLWEGGLRAVRARPIFGLGMDRFRETPPLKYESAHAHNQFIHLAAEMGIPALIAYLAILIGAGWLTIVVVRSAMPEWMIMIMRGLAWGQIGFAIFGIADAIPLGSKPGIFFWYSLALMTSIYLYGKENRLLNKSTSPEATG